MFIYNLKTNLLKFTDNYTYFYNNSFYYEDKEIKGELCQIKIKDCIIPLYIKQVKPELKSVDIFYTEPDYWLLLNKELRSNKKLFNKFMEIRNYLF